MKKTTSRTTEPQTPRISCFGCLIIGSLEAPKECLAHHYVHRLEALCHQRQGDPPPPTKTWAMAWPHWAWMRRGSRISTPNERASGPLKGGYKPAKTAQGSDSGGIAPPLKARRSRLPETARSLCAGGKGVKNENERSES